MGPNYDVVVIGTGTAGYHLALTCRKAGRKVAVVDSGPFGGTCGMRGCQPSKFLYHAAEVVHLSRQMSEIGINPTAQIHWQALMHSKASFSESVPERTERIFDKFGIDQFRGRARFVSPGELMVGNDTGLRAEHIVIAAGARPARLAIAGGELAATGEEFLSVPHLPRRVVFIGGGCLGLEQAHIARAAGADVTVLQRGERILKKFDAELAERVAESARDLGIRIVTGFAAGAIERSEHSFLVLGGPGGRDYAEGELVVNCTGRVPDLVHLDLDAGNVACVPQGVAVNEFMQSVSNPRVYAVGDVCRTANHLATVAEMEGGVAAENILNGNRQRPDYHAIPSAVFTLPPLARVGMTEEEAGEAGKATKVYRGSMRSWPTSRQIGQEHVNYKVILERESGQILGAHLFCHNAAEVVNVFALAMKFGLAAPELKQVLWAYPTNVSDIKYMLEDDPEG